MRPSEVWVRSVLYSRTQPGKRARRSALVRYNRPYAHSRRWSDERKTDRRRRPGPIRPRRRRPHGRGRGGRPGASGQRRSGDRRARHTGRRARRRGGQALWVIEADGGDGAVLIGELLARGELVATLTPTEVVVRRKGRRQADKSDLIDAEVCARIGREEQASLRRLVAVPGTVAEMRVLARYQDGLIRDRTRLINRLRFPSRCRSGRARSGRHGQRTRPRRRAGPGWRSGRSRPARGPRTRGGCDRRR